MDTNALKKFAQAARRELLEQVAARMEQVLHTDSIALREKLDVVNELREQLNQKGKENLIEEVAYTWFNRFCALRYMDVNHITKSGIVSPIQGFTQPEILQDAKQGIFDSSWRLDRGHVQGLLDGSLPSNNPEQEAYRLLLVAVCNSYAEEMAFLFPKIEDYTELLMPEDLLSAQSVLQSVRETLTVETCQDVEVIGWLYQFYISEKKDEVMAAKGAVAKEDIPAVTQLFTPHWIVRYMVENSLGRLWLLNHPESKIREQMEYYIAPVEEETDFLKVDSPEELKVLDPACGSGHILTYAFDLLYAIYEEQGYDPVSIPQLILKKNLYGIEIDKRAAMLSSFALMMKAVQKDSRFFRRGVQPNILEMEDVTFNPQEIKDYMAKVGEDLWTQDLWQGLQQFENAKELGSLIRPAIKDVRELRQRMQSKGLFEDLLLSHTNEKVQQVLTMSEYLSPRYQVVVANPPYFSKGMDPDFKQFAIDHYPDFKKDTFSMFVRRNLDLAVSGGQLGFMTPFVWMFISSYEDMRNFLIEKKTITSLIQLEYSGFEGATVPICTFTLENKHLPEYEGAYIKLSDFRGADIQAPKTREAIANPDCGWFFRASAADFKKIPGAPIAYWVSSQFLINFHYPKLGEEVQLKAGLSTGDNTKFQREWFEVVYKSINFNATVLSDSKTDEYSWFPCHSGGNYRKWYGNHETIIFWKNNGNQIRNFGRKTGRIRSAIRNERFYFREGFTWTKISSKNLGVRWRPKGFLFDDTGRCGFSSNIQTIYFSLSLLCSKVAHKYLEVLCPTLSFTSGEIAKIPIIFDSTSVIINNAKKCIEIEKMDWNQYETSWDFWEYPLISRKTSFSSQLIKDKYKEIRSLWRKMTHDILGFEEENNRIFIDIYNLENELSSEIPLDKITLKCNPYYRYSSDLSKDNLEDHLLEDTMKEFISYAVGCTFGRYSLDKPGLILANQGETIEDYYKALTPTLSQQEREQKSLLPLGEGQDEGQPISVTFAPTETNVIPIVEGEWFADDAVSRFKKFLRVTFGEENYTENLQFIEDALGKDLEKYFLRDFYKDHVQMYKKRPIYWLFSSPDNSFNALIYMHRYQPDTVSVVLNQYLREYRDKLIAHRRHLDLMTENGNASARDKSRAIKESEAIAKVLAELKIYEDEVLYPLASERIEINLDDGVVVNYAKFGEALKKI